MRCAMWICRATCLAALGVALVPASAARGDDDAASGEKSPPPKTEPLRPEPRQTQPLIDDTDQSERGGRRRMAPPNFHLGAHLVPVSPELNDQLDLKGEGLLVVHVEPQGPAGKAGIKHHDILLAAGDKSIKSLRDVIEAINQTDGKQLSIKLLRGGKPLTVSVTPLKREVVARRSRVGDVDLSEIETVIKEKLKNAGVDMRMEFFQPGRIFPRGAFKVPEFPDDLTVNVHKQGKNPAEVEVKKGDKTWNVKEDDLNELPDDVRPHVEALLGHGNLPFAVHFPGRPGPPGPPSVDFGADGPAGPPHGPDGGPPDGPSGRAGAPGSPRPQGRQLRDRPRGSLERRLEEMSARLQEMRRQVEDLREGVEHSFDGDAEKQDRREKSADRPKEE